MVDLPSFFNKTDFFGKILPGYVTVILFLVLLRPDLFSNSKAVSSSAIASLDIFSAVVFIVAGPAAGFTLTMLSRSIEYIPNLIFGYKDDAERKRVESYLRRYAKLRLSVNDADKIELDQTEAELDFCRSTTLGIFVVDLSYLANIFFSQNNITPKTFQIPIFILIVILILIVGAYFQRNKSLNPIIEKLLEKCRI
ncbi:MAG: hypothetical protein WCF03_12325 [Nitrososphaeraceae archaeon]